MNFMGEILLVAKPGTRYNEKGTRLKSEESTEGEYRWRVPRERESIKGEGVRRTVD